MPNCWRSLCTNARGRRSRRSFRRYTDIVYSAALRQAPCADGAEEITQAVFVILAQKAGAISQDTPLVGWLLTTTRFAAMNFRRCKSAADITNERQP